MNTMLDFLHIDAQTRSVSLDARNPAFYGNPNATYALLPRTLPNLLLEGTEAVVLHRYDHVNALLRDRRFGRQILHIATREEHGLPEPARTPLRISMRQSVIPCSRSSPRSTPGCAPL